MNGRVVDERVNLKGEVTWELTLSGSMKVEFMAWLEISCADSLKKISSDMMRKELITSEPSQYILPFEYQIVANISTCIAS